MNVELLQKVKAEILAHPKRFIMYDWILTGKETETFSNGLGQAVNFDHCGTAACIAGWACVLKQKSNKMSHDPDEQASLYLGFSDGEGEKLFYVGNWPKKFCRAWVEANTMEAQAQVAADRIDHFIATQGKE